MIKKTLNNTPMPTVAHLRYGMRVCTKAMKRAAIEKASPRIPMPTATFRMYSARCYSTPLPWGLGWSLQTNALHSYVVDETPLSA